MNLNDAKILISDDSILARKQLKDAILTLGKPTFIETSNGQDAIDSYKVNMDADEYRLGRATMSTSKGTEQLNATKYGIQGVNLEISRIMKVFSGNTDCSAEVMTRGAEVYANFLRTVLASYNPHDRKDYAPNLPWKE